MKTLVDDRILIQEKFNSAKQEILKNFSPIERAE